MMAVMWYHCLKVSLVLDVYKLNRGFGGNFVGIMKILLRCYNVLQRCYRLVHKCCSRLVHIDRGGFQHMVVHRFVCIESSKSINRIESPN